PIIRCFPPRDRALWGQPRGHRPPADRPELPRAALVEDPPLVRPRATLGDERDRDVGPPRRDDSSRLGPAQRSMAPATASPARRRRPVRSRADRDARPWPHHGCR
ncbi:unnamed protein product, partial [Ectocarpus fasciculatus]